MENYVQYGTKGLQIMRKSDSDKGPISNGSKSESNSPNTPKRKGSKKHRYTRQYIGWKYCYESVLVTLKALKIFVHVLHFRKKFKRSLTMTSLPLAFFKGCTSGNTDPNSPTSPIMTNGSGNVIGNNTLWLYHNNQTTANPFEFRCCLQFYQPY